jgi:flagellar basal-body rod modification protein FlgD
MSAIPPISTGFGIPQRPRKSELDAETFMRLLAVQLSTQNPLEPMNDRDFFAQMAQLGSVTGLSRMEQSLQVVQASSLIGKTVTAYTTPNDGTGSQPVSGVAQSLVKRDGEFWLTLKVAGGTTVDVRMSTIQSVAL